MLYQASQVGTTASLSLQPQSDQPIKGFTAHTLSLSWSLTGLQLMNESIIQEATSLILASTLV